MSQSITQSPKTDEKPLTSFHFSCGNSANGPIGFCARVKAHSREEALTLLRKALPEALTVAENQGAIQYLQVYFNDAAVKVADSDASMDEQAVEACLI